MIYFIFKAALTGLLAAAISEIARRYPGWGGLVASLPLTSLMAMLWLYRDTGDVEKVAALSTGAMFFIVPSMPMFLAIPLMLRAGVSFLPTMTAAIVGTMSLYAVALWAAPKLGLEL
jgi:hypothetical protein